MEANLVSIIRNIAKPFAIPEYVYDWQHRAAQLSAISDLYTIQIRENPFLEEEVELDKNFLSLPPLREAIKESFDKAYTHNKINYAFDYGCLSGWQYDTYEQLYSDVDASEKIVISACAYAICNLSMPIEIMLALCNLLYEEALHLEATNTLLGTDQRIRPWIPDDKKTNWELICNTNSILSYLFTEHYLKNRNFWQIKEIVLENAKNCLLTGMPLVTDEQLVEATEDATKWCGYDL